jgi:hypothetical protein
MISTLKAATFWQLLEISSNYLRFSHLCQSPRRNRNSTSDYQQTILKLFWIIDIASEEDRKINEDETMSFTMCWISAIICTVDGWIHGWEKSNRRKQEIHVLLIKVQSRVPRFKCMYYDVFRGWVLRFALKGSILWGRATASGFKIWHLSFRTKFQLSSIFY